MIIQRKLLKRLVTFMAEQISRKTKILLVQIANRNYGDTAISDNARFLIKKAIGKKKLDNYDILDYNILSKDTGQIKYVDAVVFAGGGIVKFQNEEFDRYIIDILVEAQKYGVPTFFNAVGVEGFDAENERCVALRTALNYDCVKGISVRDDFETMKNCYIENKNIRVRSVVDSAVWSDKVYGSERENESEYIGLGVARDKIFSDYGIENIDRDFLLDFWKEVSLRLEEMGYKWKIFTNGFNSDEIFAEEVLRYIGHGEKVPQPANVGELVGTIKSFKGMIACRMHANIIAYSFGIPSIGLVWNDKLKFWGKKIGCPERYITSDALTADNVVASLTRALAKGCSKARTNLIKYKTYHELKVFIKKIKPLGTMIPCKVDFVKRMAATALGGIDFKYNNTNTLEAFESSVKAGYKFFETDVRFSKDEKIVCVNGWSKDTFKKFGLEHTEESKQGMNIDDFLVLKYYGFFKTVTFDEIVKATVPIFKNRSYKMVLDIGLPKKEVLSDMLDKIIATLKANEVNPDNFIFRLQRKNDVKVYKSKKYASRIAYFVANPKDPEVTLAEHYESIISYCKAQKISMITMVTATYNEELLTMLNDAKIKPMIMTYTKTEDIINAVDNGVEIVGSHYYGPEYLNRLTH